MKNVSIEEVKTKKKQAKGKSATAYSDEYQNNLGELLNLSKDERKRVTKHMMKEIEDWKSDSAELHKTLEDWSDILEGVVEESSWPYEGSPSIHIDLIGICMKIYHTITTRSILSQREIWYGMSTSDSDVNDMWIDKIEQMVNTKVDLDWNIKEGMRDAFYCAARDMLSVLKIPYAEDYERVKEVVYLENSEQLMEEFGGNLEESGLGEDELRELMEKIETEASPDSPVEILVEYDKPMYIGPKAYLVERIDLVTFPANAKSISREDCRGYGDRYYLRKGEVKRRGNEKLWYSEEVDKLIKGRNYDDQSDYGKSRDENLGIGDEGSKDKFEFFDIVDYFDLDDDGVEEKYLLTFSFENRKLMSMMEYPYGVDYFAFFRREKRPGQLDGRSIIGELEYVNEEIDHRHNSRTMSMDITNIPSFKARKGIKKDFDLGADENKFRPGVTFWLENPEDFEQFKIQPVDYGQSLAEENNLMKLGSLIVGFDIYTFSGRAMPEDPNAPGNKTQMLIEQGNLRMQNVLEELRFGVDQVSSIILSHLYQFGPAQISYNSIDASGRVEHNSIPKRVLRSGIMLKMRATNVVTNSDDELKRWMFARQMYLTEPTIAMDAKKRVELLRKVTSRANLFGLSKVLPTEQDLQMFEQKQAMAMRAEGAKQGGGQGGKQGEQGNPRLDNAVARAKAASDADTLKTKKVQNSAAKVKALAEMKESLGGKNAKK